MEKFKSVLASTNLENIAMAMAQVLENVLKTKPLIEVMKTPSGKHVFREDRKYFTLINGEAHPFNPFTADGPALGDVYCDEKKDVIVSKKNLDRAWGSLDFDYISNPVLHQIVADLLTFSLNQDQTWAKQYRGDGYGFLQEYIDVEKMLMDRVPQLLGDYRHIKHDIAVERTNFISNIAAGRGGATVEQALKVYEATGKGYETNLVRDFWSRSEMQQALRELTVSLEKIVLNLFPAVRVFAERSLHPAYGYDVFLATVETGNQLVVKSLGDYRILHWELQQ